MHKRVCLANVPALIFHSIRRHDVDELGDLSLEERVFELQLAALARGGYRSIRCSQLFEHLAHGAQLPPRPILITFDDGYLDNFTIAGPLLRRHGFSATVFVASDSIERSSFVRATTEIDARAPESGYATSAELCEMERSGTFEIQAHSAAHARFPIGPEVVDFHRPAAPCRWLIGHRFAELRPHLHTGAHDARVAWGAPVWRSAWMGEARAFVPEPDLEARLTEHVRAHGGAGFFERASWRAELDRIVAHAPIGGRHETEVERRARLIEDVSRSRVALESILGHAPQFMAWPGGGSSPLAIEVAVREAGFRATFGTDRAPPGVEPGPQAIPRTYFNQRYRGGCATLARVWKLRGVADYESGRWAGYARVFAANRLMQLFGGARSG